MLHPSISRKGIVQNGIYPNEFAPSNGQTPPTAFRADLKDILTITHAESFGVAATFAGAGAYGFKAKVNDTAIAAISILSQTTSNVAITEGGVLAYSGAGDTTVVLGNELGKPFVAPFVFTVLDLVALSAKVNNFTLTLGPSREIYNFSVQPDNSVKLYVRNGAAWDLVNTFPFGQALTATDTVSYRITNEKIELLLNNVSKWEKARNWTVLLSNAALGVLTPAAPYLFGQSATLTVGSVSGSYVVSIHNQEGVSLKIDQPIEVGTDYATTDPVTEPDIIIPVLAATVLANNATTKPVTLPGSVSAISNSMDWGKVLTWSGIALAGIVVVAGLMWAIRGKN